MSTTIPQTPTPPVGRTTEDELEALFTQELSSGSTGPTQKDDLADLFAGESATPLGGPTTSAALPSATSSVSTSPTSRPAIPPSPKPPIGAKGTDTFRPTAPLTQPSTAGIPIEEANRLGLKGSEIFGTLPSTTPQADFDSDEMNEDWADDGDDPTTSEGQAITGQTMISFTSVDEARAYLNETQQIFAENMNEAQRIQEIDALRWVYKDLTERMRLIRLLSADDDWKNVESFDVHVRVPPTASTEGVAQTAVPPSPAKPVVPPSPPPKPPVASKAVPPSPRPTIPTLPKDPDQSKLAQTGQTPTGPSAMTDKCENKGDGWFCTSQRQKHLRATEGCFNPACPCGGSCRTFVGPSLPSGDGPQGGAKAAPPTPRPSTPTAPSAPPVRELTYEPIVDKRGEAGQQPAPPKSGPTVAKSENAQQPASDGVGQVQQASASPQHEAGVNVNSVSETATETGQQKALTQVPIDAELLAQMLTFGNPNKEQSDYWPEVPQNENENVRKRRASINTRVAGYWDRAIHTEVAVPTKEGQVKQRVIREDLDLRSTSYRVILTADRLAQAIEEYTIGGDDKVLVEIVSQAAVKYLNAHKPLEPHQADPNWAEYLEYCQMFQLPIGTMLHEVAERAKQEGQQAAK